MILSHSDNGKPRGKSDSFSDKVVIIMLQVHFIKIKKIHTYICIAR